MADTTWGVKVPEELKERLSKAMQDADLSGKEFIESLLQTYELNIIKQTQPIFSADIEELQALTSRINMVYVNLAERIETLSREKEKQFNVQLDSKDNIVRMFDTKNRELQLIIDQMKSENEDLKTGNIDSLRRIQELNEIGEINKALVMEYKEKNDTLAGLLNEYKGYKADNSILKDTLQDERQKLMNIEATLKEKIQEEKQKVMAAQTELRDAQKDIDKLTQKNEDLKTRHIEEIDRIQAKSEFEKEKAVLQIKTDYQNKISDIQEQYNQKISTFQNEYNSEVKLLLSRIDELQSKITNSNSGAEASKSKK